MTTRARNTIDLHCHTRRSDGVLEPLELWEAMRAWGMGLVAITDHDTLAAVRELRGMGLGSETSPAGPRLVAGIEINTVPGADPGEWAGRDGEELHILGYGLDPHDEVLASELARQRDGRRTRLARTLGLLAGMGMDVSDLLRPGALGAQDPEASVGRPHVARALVEAGHATSVEDAFARLLGHGCPAYVRRVGMGPREAIERITASGGLAVLAHAPYAPDSPALIETLMGWGLRGLEVHYRTFDDATVARLAAFAREAGLLATGGSDYHGDLMDYATAQATTHVPTGVGEALLAALEPGARPAAALGEWRDA